MFPTHHVLAQQFADHPVIYFLRGQFNHDAIGNLMALPSGQGLASDLSSSPHTGGHLGSYYDGFSKYLEAVKASPRFGAALAGDKLALDELASDVSELVAAAKYALGNGHLFANTPTGMTREEANEENEKWFANWRKYAADNQAQIRQMQETIHQLHSAGQRNAALRWPLLSPTSSLGLADRIEIFKRDPNGSPISLQFTAVGPVPGLPGLIPTVVDTRLPGFFPPPLEGLNQPEGFTPSNPLLSYGLRGFPVSNPALEGLGQLPPSTAVPNDPLVLKFDPATGAPLPFSERSPILEPDAPSVGTPPNALYGVAALAALTAVAPEFLALWGVLGAARAASARGAGAESGAESSAGGVFSAGTTPYNAFVSSNATPRISESNSLWSAPGSPTDDKALDREAAHASNFADRFGNWTDTPAGSMPAQPSNTQEVPVPPAAGTVAPEEVRRLTRVNASNAGSVFVSGSAPVPYLPSTEFNDRFGNWTMPIADGRPSQMSKPIGMFGDEPSYLIPPPIFGVDGPGNPRNDAEEWFSRWIRPFLRPE
ncbi:hypothetical protein GWG65_20350 [Bradyrhizobium sp. CSA207]|uniref:hypothetical protein n=1 Tax=Bradyrhizobium sp. CSA207 TaxID=2698826 RepID=UPI0023AF46D2|nr:hypothetical protein [Bradyrhizobium sp. CSA207]MDE5443757.1 hypothetical protein [Bradyrhizobium sp. CSA207]